MPEVAVALSLQRADNRVRDRIARINAGDGAGFWDLVRENRDDLKWCGSSPFYTFLKAIPGVRGDLLRSAVKEDTVWTEWDWHGTRRDGTPFHVVTTIIFGLRNEQ